MKSTSGFSSLYACKLLVLFVNFTFLINANGQNGIYSGNGVIPTNTKATTANTFFLGDLANTAQDSGTYFHVNTDGQRLDLITQGLVRLGDPNAKGQFPAWFEVNTQNGVVSAYAATDILFQTDSLFYSFHQGGFQLPALSTNPVLFTGDRGMIMYNDSLKQVIFWDGSAFRPLQQSNIDRPSYKIVTSPLEFVDFDERIYYLQPEVNNLIWILPPVAIYDQRVFEIKNVSNIFSLYLSPTSGEQINNSSDDLILPSGHAIRIQATSIGWQVL